MHRRCRPALLLAVAIVLAFHIDARGQATTGQISGVVKDVSGGVMPGVSITVTEARTGFKRTTVTNAGGAYILVSLPLGDYSVSAELQGFKKAERSGYVLVAD